MAVAKMKLLRLNGPVTMFDQCVSQCVLGKDFHPEFAMDIMKSAKALHRMDDPNPYQELVRRAKMLADRESIKLDYRPFDGKERTPEAAEDFFNEFESKLSNLRAESESQKKKAAADELVIAQLEHIHGLNIEIEKFFTMEYVTCRFGRFPRETYDHFVTFLAEGKTYYFLPTSIEYEYVYGMYLAPSKYSERVETLFASLRFEQIYIDSRIHGDPDAARVEIKAEIESAKKEAEQLEKDVAAYLASVGEELLSWYSMVKYMSDAFDVRKYAVATADRFFLYGWIPADAQPDFQKILDDLSGVNGVIDEPEAFSGIDPPIKLRNHKFFRPFEPFIEMYGHPSYNETDPTPIVTIIYTILFGLMFGDVGQGVLVAIVGYLMWKFKKMFIGRVLIYTGICGSMFGFMYGSVFGFEHILPFGFHVLENSANTNKILQVAIFVGVGLVFAMMLVNVYNGLKQKNYEKAIFGQNGVAGMFLFAAVVLVLLPMLGFLDVEVPGVLLLIFLIVPVILIILKAPLGHLIARDPDWMPESIGDFLLENIFELIEVFLGYISNAVSFLRVGIYAISHAAMMSLVFMLAGGEAAPNMVVVVFGNLIVMALEATLVAIQVLRLNFYELFGRFFVADGRAFKSVEVNYTD